MNAPKNNPAEVFGKYRRQLGAFIARRIPSREEAEDILQDVFMRFVQTDALNPVTQVAAWLFRAARNRIIDHSRKRREERMPQMRGQDDESGFVSEITALLTDEVGVSAESADEILKFIAITGSNDQVLSALEGYAGRNETFDEGLDQLKTVVKYLSAFGVPEENFAVDLTIARGLDYYTGTVYETALLDHPEIGSVCSGGRYDNLAEYYTDKQLPGVGISIGLTRLFYVLGEQGMLNGDLPTAPADVLILPMTEDLSAAVTLATKLRDAGVRTQLYTEQKKFKAKMNYADKTGVPYVVFLGEDEVKNNVIACKDMTSGEQTTLDFAATLARIRDGLAERNKGKVIVEK